MWDRHACSACSPLKEAELQIWFVQHTLPLHATAQSSATTNKRGHLGMCFKRGLIVHGWYLKRVIRQCGKSFLQEMTSLNWEPLRFVRPSLLFMWWNVRTYNSIFAFAVGKCQKALQINPDTTGNQKEHLLYLERRRHATRLPGYHKAKNLSCTKFQDYFFA